MNRLAAPFIIVVACVLMQACRAYYHRADRVMEFDGLPEKVQNKFLEVFENTSDSVWMREYCEEPVFIQGYNVTGDTVIITPPMLATPLDIDEKGVIVRTNDYIYKLDFDIYGRIFVIEGDTIYYSIGCVDWSRHGITLAEASRYGASKMSKNKYRFLKGIW